MAEEYQERQSTLPANTTTLTQPGAQGQPDQEAANAACSSSEQTQTCLEKFDQRLSCLKLDASFQDIQSLGQCAPRLEQTAYSYLQTIQNIN